MQVKNAIKGMLNKYDLEEITIITDDRIAFCGNPYQWKTTDVDMILYKREIENSEVIHRMMFNNRKAFIFIGNPIANKQAIEAKSAAQKTGRKEASFQ